MSLAADLVGKAPEALSPEDSAMLERIQRRAFDYFIQEQSPDTGLVADKTRPDWPASIAATGLALTCFPLGVERGLLTRADAVRRTLAALRFFRYSHQGTEPDATGYRGFYYHFLDIPNGRRAWRCELSTVDSALLLAGALVAATYFDDGSPGDREVRALADGLYRRVDWHWALNGGATIAHGWTPESGFLPYRWEGYDEALILYVLALGSPTSPLPRECYEAWLSSYAWRRVYDHELIYAGPLFIHQLSHCWIDFRGIGDAFTREHGLDYFENSRRATYVQREYAIKNPHEFDLYGERCWGITASDGPGPRTLRVAGVERQFYDYLARGAPFGPDDGTLAPWGVVASLPFAPEIVLPAVRYFVQELDLEQADAYGFKATFNPTYPDRSENPFGWVSPWNYGINQGPIAVMIENFQSAMVWRLTRRCAPIVAGLRRAGFSGGWL